MSFRKILIVPLLAGWALSGIDLLWAGVGDPAAMPLGTETGDSTGNQSSMVGPGEKKRRVGLRADDNRGAQGDKGATSSSKKVLTEGQVDEDKDNDLGRSPVAVSDNQDSEEQLPSSVGSVNTGEQDSAKVADPKLVPDISAFTGDIKFSKQFLDVIVPYNHKGQIVVGKLSDERDERDERDESDESVEKVYLQIVPNNKDISQESESRNTYELTPDENGILNLKLGGTLSFEGKEDFYTFIFLDGSGDLLGTSSCLALQKNSKNHLIVVEQKSTGELMNTTRPFLSEELLQKVENKAKEDDVVVFVVENIESDKISEVKERFPNNTVLITKNAESCLTDEVGEESYERQVRLITENKTYTWKNTFDVVDDEEVHSLSDAIPDDGSITTTEAENTVDPVAESAQEPESKSSPAPTPIAAPIKPKHDPNLDIGDNDRVRGVPTERTTASSKESDVIKQPNVEEQSKNSDKIGTSTEPQDGDYGTYTGT